MKRRTFLTLLASAVSERALAQATVLSSCGSVTLSAGTPHNVTIDVNGQSCQSGASGGTPTSVWSASDAAANGMTLSNGGLTFTSTDATDWRTIRGSISKSSGKLYVEYLAVNVVGPIMFGVGSSGISIAVGAYLGSSPYGAGFYAGGGNTFISMGAGGATIATAPFGAAAGDVVSVAIDLDAGKFWLAKNNVWQTGNPSTGATPQVTYVPAQVAPFFPGITSDGVGASWTLQSTAASQKYAPPSGFSAWG